MADAAIALFLALQAASGTPSSQPLMPVDFNLGTVRRGGFNLVTTRRGCAVDDPETILVCGRRLPPPINIVEEWERRYATSPLLAERRLFGNVIGGLVADSVTMDRGAVSNRFMIRLRTAF